MPVSLCGDMASDPARPGRLCSGWGCAALSVAPAALGRVKLAVSEFNAAPG